MIHEGALLYRGARYLWVSLGLILACVILYSTQRGPRPAGGGTWQGYVLGTVGALLILWLAWLGIRKRRYASTVGSVAGWTSAHVYLGLSLIAIATERITSHSQRTTSASCEGPAPISASISPTIASASSPRTASAMPQAIASLTSDCPCMIVAGNRRCQASKVKRSPRFTRSMAQFLIQPSAWSASPASIAC